MTGSAPKPRIDLLSAYHAAQQLQHGGKAVAEIRPTETTPVEIPRRETPPINPPSVDTLLRDIPGALSLYLGRAKEEARIHPIRSGIIGLAVTALVGSVIMTGCESKTSPEQTDGTTVVVGDTAKGSQQEAAPTGDPKDITFSSLFGERVKIGALLMKDTHPEGQIVYTLSDNSIGKVTLPNMTHQQNIELSVQPLLSPGENNTYMLASPIEVTQKDNDFLVTIDRSKIAVIFNYAMPGDYVIAKSADGAGTTVTLSTKNAQDSFSLTFFPSSSMPLSADTKGLAADEIARVNGLAAANEDMATKVAEVISFKKSVSDVESVTSNSCYNDVASETPANTTALVSHKIDWTFKTALEKWASDHQRTLYLSWINDYPIDNQSVVDQYTRSAVAGDSTQEKTTARDIEAIKTNPYARYFGTVAEKILCIPNEKLKTMN